MAIDLTALFLNLGGTSELKSSHLQNRLLGLPAEIPWPGELPDPPPDEPLRMDELLQAIPRAEADPDDETIFTRYTDDLLSLEEYEKLVIMLGPVYKAGKSYGSRKCPYAKALHCLGHHSDGLKILDEMLKDKKLSKAYLSNIQIQRDLWTGYITSSFPI